MADVAQTPTLQRAPTCSASGPSLEAGAAGPALAPSNAERQAELGLGGEDEDFSAAVAELRGEGGGYGAVLRSLGFVAPVLLDALPRQAAYGAALDAWDVPASQEWVAEQPATDLAHLPSTLVLRLLDQLWPDGSFAEAFLKGVDLTVFGGEGTGDLSAGLSRERSRLAVALSLAAGAGLGLGLGASADAAGDRGGFLLQAGWQQGLGFDAEWALDLGRLLALADASLGGVLGAVSVPDVLAATLEALSEQLLVQVPRKVEVTGTATADVNGWVGVEAGDAAEPAVAALEGAKESMSAALGASLKSGSGYVGLRGHFFVEGVAKAEAASASRGEEDRVGGEAFVRVDGWLPLPGTDGELEVVVTYGTRTGGDGERERRTFGSLDEALAALDAALADGGEPAVGDLVVGRTHEIDGEAAAELREQVDLSPLFGRFDPATVGATSTVSVDVEVMVAGYQTNPEFETRDEQRAFAAAIFGEAPPPEVEADGWELRKAELTHRMTVAAPNLTVMAGEFGASTGTAGGAGGRKVDLAGELDADGVAALLQA